MNTVKFGNPGKIDPRVWSTFGVSIKETSDPIGQFGTGLKYAIAVCLREGRKIWIESCGERFVFAVEPSEMRGQVIQQITCNGAPMPYTTHLGKNWSLWQAYRELYSNCRDEGGDLDQDGDTVVYAELGDIEHSEVFLSPARKPIATSRWVDIYAGQSSVLYVKGIRARDLQKPAKYTYSLKLAELTEDRTIKWSFQVERAMSSAILESDNAELARDYILGAKGFFEEAVGAEYAEAQPSETAKAVVSQFRKKGVYMQEGIFKACIQAMGGEQIDTIELTTREVAVIQKASAFCAAIGMPVTFPMLKADLAHGTLAMACLKTNQIYLSRRVLEMGVKQVASTLLEENLHLAEHLDDCTYDMQTRLFDIIVTFGEQITGEVL